MKILLVEPDALSADIVCRAIRDDVITVEHVVTAQAAIHAADQRKPDVIILELLLADQNGIALLQELRSHYDWMDIPIVVHTHIPFDELAVGSQQWESLGVLDYLYKPTTSLAKLKNRIQMVLS